MKIITWNMHYCDYYSLKSSELLQFHYMNHISAWNYMIKKIDPDIALLQEVNPISKYCNNLIFKRSHTSENEELLQWGTGIYVNNKVRDNYIVNDITENVFPNGNKFDGKSVIIQLTNTNSNKAIYIISLHTDTTDYTKESKDITVDHLDYIFRDDIINLIGCNYIIGGDFNIDASMYNGKYKYIFNNFLDKGLLTVIDKPYQTFFGENCGNKSYYQDDHIFIHKSMKANLQESYIWNYGLIKKYSDHSIVETNISLESET